MCSLFCIEKSEVFIICACQWLGMCSLSCIEKSEFFIICACQWLGMCREPLALASVWPDGAKHAGRDGSWHCNHTLCVLVVTTTKACWTRKDKPSILICIEIYTAQDAARRGSSNGRVSVTTPICHWQIVGHDLMYCFVCIVTRVSLHYYVPVVTSICHSSEPVWRPASALPAWWLGLGIRSQQWRSRSRRYASRTQQ